MRRTYITPQTEWLRMTECEAMLQSISGGISNSGQDDDGGSAKVTKVIVVNLDDDDFWEDEGDDGDLWGDLWSD